MHWIQTIRENLELSQEELASYLRLSPHMIQSVELDRRQLPVDSLRPALLLYQAIEDLQARGPVSEPTVATDHYLRSVKRLHREYRIRLDRCTGKLEKMQRSHASASFCLCVYQFLAQYLAPSHRETDPYRLRWIQRKINEATQRIKDNHPTAQDLLTVEIAGLRSMVQALEGSPFFRDG